MKYGAAHRHRRGNIRHSTHAIELEFVQTELFLQPAWDSEDPGFWRQRQQRRPLLRWPR